MSEDKGLSQQRLAALIERYGTDAKKVAAYLQEGPDSLLSNHNGYSRREIEYLARHERVVHLDDLILRRTLMGMLGEINLLLLKELAVIISTVIEWSPEESEAEVERTVKLLRRVHGVNLEN
jgi:glycerol-3-phosphate dehydrogenase